MPPERVAEPPGSSDPDPTGEATLLEYLEPVPTPAGTNSREIVTRAVGFDAPPRIPYSFFRPLRSDFFELAWVEELVRGAPGGRPRRPPGERYTDEWGVARITTGGRWDRVIAHPLADLAGLDAHRWPALDEPGRYQLLAPWVRRARRAGKYSVAFDPVLLYQRSCELVGFQDLLVAPYAAPDALEELLDRLADLTIACIERWAGLGQVDGFMTWEDWGSQHGLPVGLDTFRRFFAPRYARIVEAAHRGGLHYIWHECGRVLELLPELVELGVDVVQLDQPRLMGHRTLADACGGRICFWNAVDTQWATGAGEADLRAEVAQMVTAFQGPPGGFMARQYPHGEEVGLSERRQHLIYRAFLANGCS